MARGFRQWTVAVLLLAIACGKSETPPEPGASPRGPSSGAAPAPLPLEAQRQIRALLAEKDARTFAQQKIDSRLLYRIKMERGEPIAQGIERLDSSIKVGSDGSVRVDIRTKDTERVVAAVRANGGEVLGSFPRFHSVTARVPLTRVERVAEEPSLDFVEELLDPQPNAAPEGPATDVVNTSTGDVTHEADAARATYGLRGNGVKIGVLSDSVDHLALSQSTGDLGPVTVLPGASGVPGTGEGTAMLEIVHDLVPDAELYFATAFGGTASFATNIVALRAAGCDVIVDDVFYYNESPFQDATIAQAVNTVVASGAIYVSSAGNAGSIAKNRSGVYQGNFIDSGTSFMGAAVNRFDNGTTIAIDNQLTAANSGGPMSLFWSDPLAGSNNDYDLFVFNAGLTTVTDLSTNIQNGTQDPYEQSIGSPMANSRLVIVKKAPASARYLHLNSNRGRLSIPTIGQTKGHASAAGAFAVAATPAGAAIGAPPNPVGPFPLAFNAGNLVELFSSDGPRKIFYNADGTLANPGNPSLLDTGGIVRQKPDITAADGVPTATPGFAPFYGTSAAAPHFAGLAALLKSAVPSASGASIRTALTSTAIDIEGAGIDVNSGAGIAMAPAALAALGASVGPALSLGSRTLSANGGNMNGTWDPGESAALLVNLANVGAVTAVSVSATLATTAPNVTITQPMSAYPDIAVGGNAANTAPFGLSLAGAAACNSIPVRLTVAFSGRQAAFDFVVDVGTTGSPATFSFTGPPVAIPDSPIANVPGAAANVPIVVSGLTGGISDVNFRIDGTASSIAVGSTTVGISHSFVGDLALTLTSPAGASTALIGRIRGGVEAGNNFFSTVLDDSATASIQLQNGTNPFTGTFLPDLPLAVFNNQSGNGTWTLSVRDYGPGDTGNVRAVSLVITPRVCASLAGLGTPCSDDAECGSGHCTDNVCCNDACGDDAPNDCQACSAAGLCGAAPAASVCRASVGACDAAETCSGQTTCPPDSAAPVGTLCGGTPSGDCDAQDTCSGSVGATATCTANLAPSSSVCRPSAGGCDPAENCTGSSTSCPSDVILSSGTTCRAAANACDLAETCNGTSPTCGANLAVMSGTACGGPPSGDCDAQDTCSGSVGASATCVANFKQASVECRASAGDCDLGENCTGTSAACPTDAFQNGTTCRTAVNGCDVAETCSGSSAACGADAAVTPGTACGGPPSGDCDAQDTCSGTVGASATCVVNYAPASVECRASGGDCDVAEHCTGSATACPADVLVPSGNVCRGAANDCDVAETCNGVSPVCAADTAKTPGSPCGGAPSGTCDLQDTCSGTVGASATCVANYRPATFECRGTAGLCDLAENCSGTAPECPADVKRPSGSVCRPAAANGCDVSEACDGASPACAPDAAVTPGTPCGGPPNGDCDAQDSCAGTVGASATCVANYLPRTTICRGSGGSCDIVENCTGASTLCPPDAVAQNGTVCRPSVGECDPAEACNGASPACGADAAATPGTACGGLPNGACDAQDRCSGAVGLTATCEPRFQPASTLCRASAGDCDLAENCTGIAVGCPADALVQAGTSCRPSVGECDAPEACSGTSATCGADAAQPSGTPCGGPPSGDCDAQDTCTGGVGASAACAARFQAASVVCRAPAGDCDLAENCSGSAPTCPADALAGSSVECRPAAGDCDVAEHCSGAASCPANGFASSGASCADGSACTANDQCDGSGACQPGSAVNCDDGNVCTTEHCEPATGCVAVPVTDGTQCVDGDACTSFDRCIAGACQSGDPAVCDDRDSCTADTCDSTTGCVHALLAPGSACDDGNHCTLSDTCDAAGTCIAGPARDCDDGNDCTTESCDVDRGCRIRLHRDGTPCNGGQGVCIRNRCETGEGGAGGEAGDGAGAMSGRGGTSGTSGAGASGEAGEAGASTGGRGGTLGTGGGGGTAGLGEGGGDEAGAPGTGPKRHGHVTETGGCGCRVPGKSGSGVPTGAAWLVVPLLVALRRRRRGVA